MTTAAKRERDEYRALMKTYKARAYASERKERTATCHWHRLVNAIADCASTGMVIGTDDESAVKQAISDVHDMKRTIDWLRFTRDHG